MTDLEARLRATYRAVAATTEIAAPSVDEVHLRAGPPLPPRTRGVWLRVAAALVLVAGVGAVVSRELRPASTSEAARPYALPIGIPDNYILTFAGLVEATNVSGYTTVDGTTTTVASLHFQRGTDEIVVNSAPADRFELTWESDHHVELLSGVVARMDDFANGPVLWFSYRGAVVAVSSNDPAATVESLANALWFVTPDLWDHAVGTGGFLSRDDESRGLDAWQPPGDRFDGSRITVKGSLQTGLEISTFGGTVGTTSVDRCRAYAVTNDGKSVLVSTAAAPIFLVTTTDGGAVHLDGASPPGLPSIVVRAFREPNGSTAPALTCEERP